MEVVAGMSVHSLIIRPPHGPFTIRELGASDTEACRVFVDHLDRQDIRLRFATQHVSMDYLVPALGGASEDVAFAALDASEAILGVVNLARLNAAVAELAVMVRSDCKRRGLGRSLLVHALGCAAARAQSQVFGLVLVENEPMLALARNLGFETARWDGLYVEVRSALTGQPATWGRRLDPAR